MKNRVSVMGHHHGDAQGDGVSRSQPTPCRAFAGSKDHIGQMPQNPVAAAAGSPVIKKKN
jgi:hypothetical protein